MLLNFLENINFLGYILIFVSFLFGIKLPDWDFKLRLRHRSIVTHSPFITILLILSYKLNEDFFFKYFIVGFSTSIAIHMLFDLFPYKWKGGALLKIPFNKISCSPQTTKLFFLFTILINSFIALIFMSNFEEFLFVIFLSIITFIRKIKYERTFIRPALIFSFLMFSMGILKFKNLFNLTVKLINYII